MRGRLRNEGSFTIEDMGWLLLNVSSYSETERVLDGHQKPGCERCMERYVGSG